MPLSSSLAVLEPRFSSQYLGMRVAHLESPQDIALWCMLCSFAAISRLAGPRADESILGNSARCSHIGVLFLFYSTLLADWRFLQKTCILSIGEQMPKHSQAVCFDLGACPGLTLKGS